jgi:hypothetical protein
MSEWQPIDTAPLDREVLFFIPPDRMRVLIWNGPASDFEAWKEEAKTPGRDPRMRWPTHWQELPQPPGHWAMPR